jgi:hypothetical protein
VTCQAYNYPVVIMSDSGTHYRSTANGRQAAATTVLEAQPGMQYCAVTKTMHGICRCSLDYLHTAGGQQVPALLKSLLYHGLSPKSAVTGATAPMQTRRGQHMCTRAYCEYEFTWQTCKPVARAMMLCNLNPVLTHNSAAADDMSPNCNAFWLQVDASIHSIHSC